MCLIKIIIIIFIQEDVVPFWGSAPDFPWTVTYNFGYIEPWKERLLFFYSFFETTLSTIIRHYNRYLLTTIKDGI